MFCTFVKMMEKQMMVYICNCVVLCWSCIAYTLERMHLGGFVRLVSRLLLPLVYFQHTIFYIFCLVALRSYKVTNPKTVVFSHFILKLYFNKWNWPLVITFFLLQLEQRQTSPPYKPPLTGERDLEHFDPQFTNEPVQLTVDDR